MLLMHNANTVKSVDYLCIHIYCLSIDPTASRNTSLDWPLMFVFICITQLSDINGATELACSQLVGFRRRSVGKSIFPLWF